MLSNRDKVCICRQSRTEKAQDPRRCRVHTLHARGLRCSILGPNYIIQIKKKNKTNKVHLSESLVSVSIYRDVTRAFFIVYRSIQCLSPLVEHRSKIRGFHLQNDHRVTLTTDKSMTRRAK